MINVKHIKKHSSDVKKIRELMTISFPDNEKIPFWFLLRRTSKNFVDFLSFYDEDLFVGFMYLITKGDLTFVLYIAVNNKIQSKG